jgi:hypothetical protein
MTLPNFLIIGSQKCGTTSLHDVLSHHPQANMSDVKEINFFTLDKKYVKGLDHYKSYFGRLKENHVVTGEASPGYICHPKVPERIATDLGTDLKLVLILRDPIKRAFSQYWDNRRQLSENLSEEQIVKRYLFSDYDPNEKGYFSRGVYIEYIKDYLNHFDSANLHIMILEELINNQTEELQKLYTFLGMDKTLGLQKLPKASNASMIWKNPIYKLFFKHPHLQKFLPIRGRGLLNFGKKELYKYELPNDNVLDKVKTFYEPYNQQLSSFLDKPLKHWL